MRIRRPRLTPEQVLSSRPVRNQNLTVEELEDGGLRIVAQRSQAGWIRLLSALFPIPRERRIELDSVGRQVWELCDGEHTLKDMIDAFQKRHKLMRTEAEWSLRNYLRDLGKRGLVGFAVERPSKMSENQNTGRVFERVEGKAGIEQQIVLPWSRALQMTRENIFVRLGRSAITASGIFLGIAFLSAVLYGAAAQRVVANLDLEKLGVQNETSELQARVIWLAAMSLLVATVGIVNSMLMSVTERYKEIGTMKCLGALDTFIVRLFLLEAGMLGILGSGLGAIVGSGIMMLAYVGRIGWSGAFKAWGTTSIDFGGGAGIPMWLAFIITLLIGGGLSILAALYPAWRAAKMPPAAALRSEF